MPTGIKKPYCLGNTSYPTSDAESESWVEQTIQREIARGRMLQDQKSRSSERSSNAVYIKPPRLAKGGLLSRRKSPVQKWNKRVHPISPAVNGRLSDATSRDESCSSYRSPRLGKPACSMRISELAAPSKRKCIESWRANANILPENMISRLKQRVMDQEPIVKVSDAILCFKNNKHPSNTRDNVVISQNKRPTRKINKEASNNRAHAENKVMSAVFGMKVAQLLMRPVNITLNSQLKNVSRIISEEIYDIIDKKGMLKTNKATNERMVNEISEKVTIWIAKILEESTEKLLEEDLKVLKIVDRGAIEFTLIEITIRQETDLEEQEGPVLDILDDVMDSILHKCVRTPSKVLTPEIQSISSGYKDNNDNTDDVETAIGDEDSENVEVSSATNSMKEGVEDTIENYILKQLNKVIDSLKHEDFSVRSSIDHSAYQPEEPDVNIIYRKDTPVILPVIENDNEQNKDENGDIRLTPDLKKSDTMVDNVEQGIETRFSFTAEIAESITTKNEAVLPNETSLVTETKNESVEDKVSLATETDTQNLGENISIAPENDTQNNDLTFKDEFALPFETDSQNLEDKLSSVSKTNVTIKTDNQNLGENISIAPENDTQNNDLNFEDEFALPFETDNLNLEDKLSSASKTNVTNDNIENPTDVNEKQTSNVSDAIEIIPGELFEEKNKKVIFSKEHLDPMKEAEQYKSIGRENLQPDDEQLVPDIADFRSNIDFSEPNDNLLSYADESWPDDVFATKPSASVTRSIHSMGKILETDEKYSISFDDDSSQNTKNIHKNSEERNSQHNLHHIAAKVPHEYNEGNDSNPGIEITPQDKSSIMVHGASIQNKYFQESVPQEAEVMNYDVKNNDVFKTIEHTEEGPSSEINQRLEDIPSKKFDYRVHKKTAPAWIGHDQGEPSLCACKPLHISVAGTKTIVEREQEIRKCGQDLDFILMNLDKWKIWLNYISKYITRLKLQADRTRSTQHMGPAITDNDTWRKLNKRTKQDLRRQDDAHKFKISPSATKYCVNCGRRKADQIKKRQHRNQSRNVAKGRCQRHYRHRSE